MAHYQLTEQDGLDLESMIDRTTLETVLEALAVICTEKGVHLRENWQDIESARKWEACADRLDRLAGAQTIKSVSI